MGYNRPGLRSVIERQWLLSKDAGSNIRHFTTLAFRRVSLFIYVFVSATKSISH